MRKLIRVLLTITFPVWIVPIVIVGFIEWVCVEMVEMVVAVTIDIYNTIKVFLPDKRGNNEQ